MVGGWPLAGRSEELRFIDAALRRADGPRGLVLAGAAGVGKTRLAREALAVAGRRGKAARWAVATSSARDLPLGAFAPLLGDLDDNSAQLLQRAVATLGAGPGRAGVVVGVDDAHLLDRLSATVLHQLVLQHHTTVVVTLRSGEPAPDAVTALWKDGHLPRLEVQPLSVAETTALLASVLGGHVASATVATLWALTKGNVLYLRQIVDQALGAERLAQVRGVWRLTGDPEVPPSLAELVAARMGTLPAAVGKVVDVLAMAEPLGLDELGALAGAESTEEAETRGLVEVEPGPGGLRARLAHPLYGEARRREIGVLRARRLRGEVVQQLARTGGADAFRAAVLSLESDITLAPAALTSAARHAAWLLDMRLAERLARAAVAAGGGFAAQQVLAYFVSVDSRSDVSAAEARRLAELAESDLDRAAVALIRASTLFWSAREPQEAEDLVTEALAGITDPAARGLGTGVLATFASYRGRPREAIAAATEALQTSGLTDSAIALNSVGLGNGLSIIGRTDELDAVMTRGYAAAARSLEATFMRFPLTRVHAGGLCAAGYIAHGVQMAEEFHAASGALAGTAHLYGVAVLGPARLAAGQLGAAIDLLREVCATSGSAAPSALRYECLINLATALAVAGRPADARAAFDDAETGRHRSLPILDPELMLARAWVAAAEGALSEALRAAREAATMAAGFSDRSREVQALQTAARFGDDTVAERLAELATAVDGPRAPAAAAHAAALANGDGNALMDASQAYETMGDLVAAADAAAQAATAYSARLRRGSAATAAARAHGIAQACGANTPALGAAAQPLPLTDREREIVRLAADGMSNREIADRLVVSVRTIEGHLYRASAKLGVTGRGELAALLGTK